MGDFQQILDIKKDIKKQISFFKDKTNFNLLLETSAEQLQIIFDQIWKLKTERDLNTATSYNLDVLGYIVGEPRSFILPSVDIFKYWFGPGYWIGKYYFTNSTNLGQLISRDDDSYRAAIRAKIIINKSSGTTEDILRVIKLLTNAEFIEIRDDYPAGININIGAYIPYQIQDYLKKKIKETSAAGVSINSTLLSDPDKVLRYRGGLPSKVPIEGTNFDLFSESNLWDKELFFDGVYIPGLEKNTPNEETDFNLFEDSNLWDKSLFFDYEINTLKYYGYWTGKYAFSF